MVKIKGKVTKIGNSYGILVKKALVDAEVLEQGQEIELEVVQGRNQENSGLMTRTYDVTTTIPIIAEE